MSFALPPPWAVELLREFDPNLELVLEAWTSPQLDEILPKDDPARLEALGAFRWCVYEKACERNRYVRTRVLDYTQGGDEDDPCCREGQRVCQAFGHGWGYALLEKPRLEAKLEVLGIMLAGGPLEWLRKNERRNRKLIARDEAEQAAGQREEIAPWAGPTMHLARDNSFGEMFGITPQELATLNAERQRCGQSPYSQAELGAILNARNPRRQFAQGAPGAPATPVSGYTQLGSGLFVPNTV